jgi:hypothetical protein
MSEEFGTVNVRRGERSREIELLRQRYGQHRDALMRLVSDAPSEHLATEYQRLVRDVDLALTKLDELEGRPGGATTAAAAASTPAAVPPAFPPRGTTPVGQAQGDPLRMATEPGMRPLSPTPGASTAEGGRDAYGTSPANAQSRMLLMVVAGMGVLLLIGWLIWRASSDRKTAASQSTAPPVVVETTPATVTPVTPAPSPALLTVAPTVVDFGTVTKGTRAARQLEITNNGTTAAKIQVGRSQCRCLYYEYAPQVGLKKKETITVTLDGARAKAGVLDETISVRANKDPSLTTTFQVTGTVK